VSRLSVRLSLRVRDFAILARGASSGDNTTDPERELRRNAAVSASVR